MHKKLDVLCKALDTLASTIQNGWTGEQTFCEAWGWNCPTVTRHDMAAIASKLSADIRDADPEKLTPELEKLVSDYPRRITHMQAQTIPQFWGGNNPQASAAYISTLSAMRNTLIPIIGWQILTDQKALPPALHRKLRSIEADLSQISPKKEELELQIKNIQQANQAAESLPIDLQTLSDARAKILKFESETELSANQTKTSSNTAESTLNKIIDLKNDADKLVSQCEEAYRITTTKGLAAAFDQRANRLSLSVWIWVAGLLAALAIGSHIGSERVSLLSKAISSQDANLGIIWLHFVLSLLSIGAPIWFAWLATKQIGQRFRLAEDYAFKASVAKAYEGYRKEAAKIDPIFEARLFSSALSRLEEAPLRLVEQDSHGSPWHEFFSSKQFQKALSALPELKEKYISVAKQKISTTKNDND